MELKNMYPPQKDSPLTFLLGNISDVDILITVASAAALPQTLPYPLTIGIDKTLTETVMVTAVDLNTNQLTVTRGTPAYSWLAGSKVARVLTAEDFKNVQDNISTIGNEVNTLKESVEGQAEDVLELKTVVGDETAGLVKALTDEIERAQTAEGAEKTRAEAAESALNSDKINRTELAQVITDWSYSADGTKVIATITRYNAATQQTSQYTRTLPVVTEELMGVMTPEAYAEILSLRTDVDTLINLGGRFIGVSFATKLALTEYVVPAMVKTGDFTYVLDDETKDGATTRYVRNGNAWEFTFIIDYDPVGLATSTTAGIVKSDSGSTDGKIFVETDGTMSVIGWDNVIKENDERLNDARTPLAHKSSHATGQSDALSPGDIGALPIDGVGNDVTVTFTAALSKIAITTGDTLAIIMGKILKWLSDLGTAAFKNTPTSGNAAATEVVLGNDTRLSDSRAPTAHTHAASDIGAGTLGGQVVANATAVATLGTAQVRNIHSGTADMTAGSTSLETGNLYAMYE